MKLHLIIVLFLAFTSLSFGQTPSASPTPPQIPENDNEPIKVNTLLVNIPVIASDRNGRYISGLTKDDFLILEDGEKQPIAFFADEKAPMNVAILIDASLSTSSYLGNIQDAARDFVKILRPEDQGLIADFGYATDILSKFTSDQEQLLKAIDKVRISVDYGSNMQNAVYRLVKKEFTSVKGRKAIIVLTDGEVEGGISNKKLLSIVSESDIIIYPILFKSVIDKHSYFRNSPGMKRLKKEQMQFMDSLAAVSGGRIYRNVSDFKGAFQAIADELKTQYLIGFYPQNDDDGKKHKITVEAVPKDIVIRTKRSIQLKSDN